MKHRRLEPPFKDVRTLTLSLGLWANDQSIHDPTQEKYISVFILFAHKVLPFSASLGKIKGQRDSN